MSDWPSELLRLLGRGALVVIGVLTVLVWFAVHYLAAPGNQVSILWGLIQYTKQGGEAAQRSLLSKELPTAPLAPSSNPSFNSPEAATFPALGHPPLITRGVTDKNRATLIAAFRKPRGLRELDALASNRPLSTCPKGTFGYAFSVSLVVNWSQPDRMDKISIERFPKTGSYFEIHCHADGMSILALTTEAQAAQLPTSKGKADIYLMLSPNVFGELTTLVSLPFDRVRSIYDRVVDISPNKSPRVLEVVAQ